MTISDFNVAVVAIRSLRNFIGLDTQNDDLSVSSADSPLTEFRSVITSRVVQFIQVEIWSSECTAGLLQSLTTT